MITEAWVFPVSLIFIECHKLLCFGELAVVGIYRPILLAVAVLILEVKYLS